jgi:hypothetical protein
VESPEQPARDKASDERDAAPSWRTFATIDDLLLTCPTSAEITELHRDLDIEIDPAVVAVPCREEQDDPAPGATLTLYNALRALRMIEWDEPLPLIGATNPYEWLKTRRIKLHLFAGSGNDVSFATETTIHLNAHVLSQDFLRWWVVDAPDATYGLEGIVALMMHEARHTAQGGGIAHDCGSNDSSLALGGAWALEYDFELWMAGHTRPGPSGSPIVTEHETDAAARNASMLRAAAFCN